MGEVSFWIRTCISAHAREQGNVIGLVSVYTLLYLIHTSPAHCTMRSVRYQHTLHTEHSYCLSYRFLNNVVITTVIEMVEMVEILDGRLGKRSVERVRYVINNLLHLVIMKYGVISLVLFISTRLRLVTILSLLVKYLVILHADPCNKSYISESAVALSTFVGMAHTAPPTNTNFWTTFLLTQLLEALYLYRASNLKSTITFLALVFHLLCSIPISGKDH